MNTNDPNPRESKRTRAEAEDECRLGQLVKDTEVWLPDGSIIIVAGPKYTAFRVHQSILDQHSQVFWDLFALPPTHVDATFESTPVVSLEGDNPDDMRRLFLVLCCGRNYYYSDDEIQAVPFSVLASLIRTAHKYDIPHVLTEALARLKKFYTSDLKSWEDYATRCKYVCTELIDAVEVIALARLTDNHTLLPIAMFLCCEILNASDGAAMLRAKGLSLWKTWIV